MTVLLVLVGGALGAPCRYLLDRWVQSWHRVRFPFGTLAVNLLGCLALGVIAGGVAHHGWPSRAQVLAATGFCGGFTTFSTFAVEAVELARDRLPPRAISYVSFSCAAGIGLAALGFRLLAG